MNSYVMRISAFCMQRPHFRTHTILQGYKRGVEEHENMADGFNFEKKRECVQSCSIAESIATLRKVRFSYQLSIFDIARRLDV